MKEKIIGILRTENGVSVESTIALIDKVFNDGIGSIEITSNSQNWQEIVKHFSLLGKNIGVGSIKTAECAKEAIACGAKFLVSPGIFEDVVLCAKENGVRILPGVFLEEEVELAIKLGVDEVKFFPASAETSADLLKAIVPPYRDEVEELKSKGVILELKNQGTKELKNSINSPTEFYKAYIESQDSSVLYEVEYPEGETGFNRLKSLSQKYKDLKFYAVGGLNFKNMEEVINNYGAHGVAMGSALFKS